MPQEKPGMREEEEGLCANSLGNGEKFCIDSGLG